MKKCPFCSEQIQDDAKKCRFCGERLSELNSTQEIEDIEKITSEHTLQKVKFRRINGFIIFGVLCILAGLGSVGNGDETGLDTGIFGFTLLLGALASKSIKKRKNNLVKNSLIRKILEISALGIGIVVVFSQNNLAQRITENPVLFIPIGISLVSYIFVSLKKH